jgi:hypothetical protein
MKQNRIRRDIFGRYVPEVRYRWWFPVWTPLAGKFGDGDPITCATVAEAELTISRYRSQQYAKATIIKTY